MECHGLVLVSIGCSGVRHPGKVLRPDQLSDLWAEVTYDGVTRYWDLVPAMLSSDGTSFTIQFDVTALSGKTVHLRLYGFDLQGKQTAFTNPVDIYVQ